MPPRFRDRMFLANHRRADFLVAVARLPVTVAGQTAIGIKHPSEPPFPGVADGKPQD
jgi:hypothetical protein